MQSNNIDIREELLKIVAKHSTQNQLHRLFKGALPILQEFKNKILSADSNDKVLLIAAHQTCQRGLYQAITNDLEDDLTAFFKTIGIKNYFVKDSTENFLKKCEYYNLIPKTDSQPLFLNFVRS